jgi:hypothetical protein
MKPVTKYVALSSKTTLRTTSATRKSTSKLTSKTTKRTSMTTNKTPSKTTSTPSNQDPNIWHVPGISQKELDSAVPIPVGETHIVVKVQSLFLSPSK